MTGRASGQATSPSGQGRADEPLTVQLLGGFSLRTGAVYRFVPDPGQHVISFLAIQGIPQRRDRVAFTLWMDKPEDRAKANLRSALWRIRGSGVDLSVAGSGMLMLPTSADVDYVRARAAADAIVGGTPVADADWRTLLAGDLLPDWYDDWVILERERFRQSRLHALEAVSHHMAQSGQPARAIDLALTVAESEPLRESTVRILIESHMAEGNVVEAQRTLAAYRERMLDELGMEPSPELAALIAPRAHPPTALDFPLPEHPAIPAVAATASRRG